MSEIIAVGLCYGIGAIVCGSIYLVCVARGLLHFGCRSGPFALLHYGSRLLLVTTLWPLFTFAFLVITIQDRRIKKDPEPTDKMA